MAFVMRAMLTIFSGGVGYIIALRFMGDLLWAMSGLLSGVLIAILALIFEENVKKTPLRIIIGGAAGLITSLIIANLVTYPLLLNNLVENRLMVLSIYLLLNVFFGYFGLSVGMKKGDEFSIEYLQGLLSKRVDSIKGIDKVIDTSVIIDGRIADVCETGFIEGQLIIPQFVLQELQYIADSTDPLRRTKGRRGLEILKRLQNQPFVEVRIVDVDYPRIKGVDAKLIELAKELRCKIITNDANLYKIAELQGIKVLSINELASSLKPIVLPGEVMSVYVFKEGKEEEQGIGYLEDGTMVVIDNGRRYIGRTLDVSVTSVLQTHSGQMIFSKPKEEGYERDYRGKVNI